MHRVLLTVIAVLVLTATACGGGDTGTQDGATTEETTGAADGGTGIALVDFAIEAPSQVSAGQELTVENTGAVPHTFTAEQDGGFDTGTVEPGGSTTVSIDEPGTYEYVCTIHPDRMTGSFEVVDG